MRSSISKAVYAICFRKKTKNTPPPKKKKQKKNQPINQPKKLTKPVYTIRTSNKVLKKQTKTKNSKKQNNNQKTLKFIDFLTRAKEGNRSLAVFEDPSVS